MRNELLDIQIGARIRRLREERDLSQDDLARMIGYKSRSSINKIELGKYSLTQSKIKAIADALRVSPLYIMGWDKPLLKPQQVPLLGEIACGVPIYTNQEYTIVFESDVPCDFCLRAKGDSMIGARIHDGDIVFIRSQTSVENGEIAAVVIDDECTLKRVYVRSDRVTLMPENPSFEPMIFVGEEMDHVHIIGKAVAFQSAI